MSQQDTEEALTARSLVLQEIRTRLQEWQAQDYVMPGWQIVWDAERVCLVARFHMIHHPLPYALGEKEFEMYALGFADRRAAVMARRPRKETVKQRPRLQPTE